MKPWYGIAQYAEEILFFIQKSNSFMDFLNLSIKAKKKLMLAAVWTSKKLKDLDDHMLAKNSCIIAIRNAWLLDFNKTNATIKAWIKKAIDAKNKALEKMKKVKEKEKVMLKKEVLRMRKLATSNCKAQINIFKALLSDISIASNFHPHPIESIPATLFSPLFSTSFAAVVYLACPIDL